MANEIIIKVKSDGSFDTAGVERSLAKIRDAARDAARSANDSLGRMNRSGEETGRTFTRARDSLGRFSQESESASRSVGRARDALGRFVRDGEGVERTTRKMSSAASGIGAAFVSGLSGAAQSVFQLGSKLGSTSIQALAAEAAGTAASGGFNLLMDAAMGLLGIIPAVIGGFLALAPALLAAGGAAGAAATLFAGVGIALATLGMGFGGIGEALSAHTKQMGGAGKAAGAAADQEHQAAIRIRDATRTLAEAKDREKEAIQGVNQARRDEVARLHELDMTIRGQVISQKEAFASLQDAKDELARANANGTAQEKRDAELAVERAQYQYDSISDSLKQAQAEKKKADKDGVDGSDQVQAALKRQAEAHTQVIRAQEQLAEAMRKTASAGAGAAGGVDAFGEAMKKLSPNAQELVRTLISLQGKFHDLKMRVQDRLLDGFSDSVKDLAGKWLPHLDGLLGNMADHLNSFGKGLMDALGDSTFIKNIEKAGSAMDGFVDQMSGGVDDFIDAFGRLAGHSGPVLKKIGELIEGIFHWFDQWIKAADNSGALDEFMGSAADTLQDIFDISGKVFKIVGQVIEILFPGSKAASGSLLDGISDALDQISAWLTDPKNQKQLENVVDTFVGFVKWVVKHIPDMMNQLASFVIVVYSIGKAIGWVWNAGKGFFKFWGNAIDWAGDKFSSFGSAIKRAGRSIGSALGSMWNGMKNGFRNALNWIIDRWNSLQFTMPAIMGGITFGTNHIDHFASGGTSSGGMAMVGEHGRELVRLPTGSTTIPHGTTEAMMAQGAGGQGGGRPIIVNLVLDGQVIARAVADPMRRFVQRGFGGNVQAAYGS